ncbi:MAG: ABC transporter ATP-binding protein, partial [Nitratireductor sp.]|nr:ABC transporter ATP-binding protein [Nitratireductor sp.]
VIARAKGRDGNRFGIVWSPMNHSVAEMFDRVLLFKNGVLIEDDSPGKLAESSPDYRELVGLV